MVAIVRVVGKSNSGKTTLLEKLVGELGRRGYRVGTVKHDVHGAEMDTPGKDTWRHAQAGAVAVALAGPNGVAVIRREKPERSLESVAELLGGDLDIVLAEGYKNTEGPKIEVSRSAVSTELLCGEHEMVALVSDVRRSLGVPQFGLDEVGGLADLLERQYLGRSRSEPVELQVDGRDIPIKGFVQDMLDRAVRGMVSTLQGAEKAREIVLTLRAAKQE